MTELAAALPMLYVKPGCPWCHEVMAFLDEHGVPYRKKDSTADEIEKVSGQTKAPTLDWNGEILADFGVEELVPFLRKKQVKLEDN